MAYPAPVPSSIYRPKKLPRVIRRQLPVVRLVAFIVLGGALAVAITWRNLANERLTLDVGLQRAQIETLNKEIQQLEGQIKFEASYNRIAKWALEKKGWRANENCVRPLVLSEDALTAKAKEEAGLLGAITHEQSDAKH
jgi:hypothetical protein